MAVNYVKFARGSMNAFQRLIDGGVVDNNTLYFVTDDEDIGYIYLGTQLFNTASIDFNELLGIDPDTLRNGDIIQYNIITEQWERQALEDAIPGLGILTTVTGQTAEEALEEKYADPQNGQMAIVDGIAYIYDGTEWKPVTELGSREYHKVNDISEIDVNNEGAIYLVPEQGGSNNSYIEYYVIDGAIERMGTALTLTPEQQAVIDLFYDDGNGNLVIGPDHVDGLQDYMNNNDSNIVNIQNQLQELIEARVVWQVIPDEETVVAPGEGEVIGD